jgi:DNA-binding CsgD family transcriptional regulator
LSGSGVRFLLARRLGEPSPLEVAVGRDRLDSLKLERLSLGAIRSLLAERLELRPPRRVLLRLFDLSQGSPLVALEFGRLLAEGRLPDIGEDLPLPTLAENLFSHRLGGLTEPVRRTLLAVALTGELSHQQLSKVVGSAAIEDALAADLVVLRGGRARASHPLLAVAARHRSTASERRQVHLQVAGIIVEETIRCRHLALAAPRPDPVLARRLAGAAKKASGRGAVNDAAELAEHALRLTPPGDAAYAERLLALGDVLLAAGEMTRLGELLEPLLEELPRGVPRARAHMLLGETSPSAASHLRHLDHVLVETDDPSLRAQALARKAEVVAVYAVAQVADAERWATEAVQLSAPAGLAAASAQHALGWMRLLRGRPLDDLWSPRRSSASDQPIAHVSMERLSAVWLVFRGESDQARAALTHLLAAADERGAAYEHALLHHHLCELALRVGDSVDAAELLAQCDLSISSAETSRCEALLAVLRGRPEGLELAQAAIAAAGEHVWQRLEAQRAAGIAMLFAAEFRLAVDELSAVWEHTGREGVTNPGVFPVAPDLVEALVGVGAIEDARAVTERLARLAREQEHPWGQASAKRCRALVHAAADADTAEAELGEAAAEYAQLGLRFDAARSLLILGRAQRRRRKWAAARAAFGRAAPAFDELGSDGWADQARAELNRVGGRRPGAEGALTWTETRVAELAAGGQSNKEIAATLVVSVYTVERHLKHAYAKLGIRSRSQLAGRIGHSGHA